MSSIGPNKELRGGMHGIKCHTGGLHINKGFKVANVGYIEIIGKGGDINKLFSKHFPPINPHKLM